MTNADEQRVEIRRLGRGDEAIIRHLAVNDADFDLVGRGHPLEPLSPADASAFLANPAVVFWAAYDGEFATGYLFCQVLPLRAGVGREVMLYEIGVHAAHRRRGIGRELLQALEAWMRANGLSETWVLADNAVAIDFYEACGFTADPTRPVYMTRSIEPDAG